MTLLALLRAALAAVPEQVPPGPPAAPASSFEQKCLDLVRHPPQPARVPRAPAGGDAVRPR